ncbi:MAG TPA: hypothetical protein VM802_28645 [Chitinophaga sp.]|uniref:hypothetical protein n=1 Tax=Chitinophaga sp. TaxID=1869181 RepID=UPI002BE1394A|nr:hypothetical protein [Chitinophaga sp.]HVI48870.1 hypothetical protein [Chitinophaga sp.]
MTLPVQYLQETTEWAKETFELRMPVSVSYEELEEELAKKLAILISEDFRQFVFILYRIDIPEKKVKQILHESAASGADPYKPIAALIINRQLEKIKLRAAFKRDNLPDDEERW